MNTILIIEDEERVAGLLKAGLEENGYQTWVAYDGAMGLRLFKQHTFQLVISDVILPKMDGFELCKEIRKINPSVPILMLTALGSTDDKLEGFDAGADDYMVKPFDFRELNARIKVLLKRNTEQTAPEPEQLTYANLRIDLRQHEVFRGQTPVRLSPKEYNLLLYMVQNAERVISNPSSFTPNPESGLSLQINYENTHDPHPKIHRSHCYRFSDMHDTYLLGKRTHPEQYILPRSEE